MIKLRSQLSVRQANFAENWVKNGGNGTQAAIDAGYAPKSAHVQASRQLKNDKVRKYIEALRAEMWRSDAMTLEEALSLTASIARGEQQKGVRTQGEPDSVDYEEVHYTYTPNVEDRQRSLEHILRVAGAYQPNNDLNRELIKANIRRANAEADKVEKQVNPDESIEDRLGDFIGTFMDIIDD